jgi:hypothetical protein
MTGETKSGAQRARSYGLGASGLQDPGSAPLYSTLPAYEDGTECSETSAYKIQTPGNYPEEITLSHLHRQVGVPAYEDGTECSETSAYKIQKPWNYPEESIKHSEHGESLKSRI